MLFGWRISVVLLLAAGGGAQSGNGDAEPEVRLSCTSDISTKSKSLTCQLIRDSITEDDEDGEGDGIEKMTMCQLQLTDTTKAVKCWETFTDTLTCKDLRVLLDVNVTAQLKRGGQVSTTVNMQKIIKPRSPWVFNTTSVPESNQTRIFIKIPYNKDFLNVENQVFQLHIWSDGINTIQNISSKNYIDIDKQRLKEGSEYHVKVRAIPARVHLQGTWSEWSETFSFFTPPGEKAPNKMNAWQVIMFRLVVIFICLLLVIALIIFFYKNKIFTYMWPSIPHPKQTLVHIWKPNKGLLLNLNPEVFSSLKVYPLEKADCNKAEAFLHPAAPHDSQSSSIQSSNCSTSTTSNSTVELEISALLSRSSSEGEDSLPSSTLTPVIVLQQEDGPPTPQSAGGTGNQVEFGVNQQEEAYVTMSSFYQIK